MRLREGQNDRLRVARCNTSCEARFTAGRNGNGPRRTAGVQNRGNFSPHPTKGPWSQGARESGNHPPAAAHQQPRHDHSFPTRTISYAYTWQVICGMPISGRPMTDTDYLYTGYPACTALGQQFFFFSSFISLFILAPAVKGLVWNCRLPCADKSFCYFLSRIWKEKYNPKP